LDLILFSSPATFRLLQARSYAARESWPRRFRWLCRQSPQGRMCGKRRMRRKCGLRGFICNRRLHWLSGLRWFRWSGRDSAHGWNRGVCRERCLFSTRGAFDHLKHLHESPLGSGMDPYSTKSKGMGGTFLYRSAITVKQYSVPPSSLVPLAQLLDQRGHYLVKEHCASQHRP
jgi:hypothetical protein